ncbi:uncharacterized protein LOC124456835 [Xenia sp. Carnegie-2017]|uniref:uncharacterized protein LOC124456835 n=1 Tax=Xenia sp. Carnegie-2017 TaxID=2897299 RepID=UPI001F04BD83|nr:uncharacterized protein LOC124456835 [Xenia sp. Carnegie-2017]
MASDDELERRLLEEEPSGMKEATPPGIAMPEVLASLVDKVEKMSSKIINMDSSIKRLQSDSQDPCLNEGPSKKRRVTSLMEIDKGYTVGDAEGLHRESEPDADSANEGSISATCVRREHDALLQEISHDLEQEEEVGENINQQLADIVNKRWSNKLPEAKQKEKMEKYSRPSNCEKFIVPRVNAEIWDKLDNKTKHNDLRTANTQKTIAKVGAVLSFTTDKLLQIRSKESPDVDKLITMNTDALALLGHTMCELSMRRRDAIRPNLSKDYSSLCASHVPVTTYSFGDNLQTQLNDIRASNKISKATVPQRFDKVRQYGRPHSHGTNNSSSQGKPRKNHFLSNNLNWKKHPPRSTYPSKKPSTFPVKQQQYQ